MVAARATGSWYGLVQRRSWGDPIAFPGQKGRGRRADHDKMACVPNAGNWTTITGMTSLQGTVQGNTITLDTAVPPLEGRRVRVLIEPIEEGVGLTPETQAQLWKTWIESGPQGPIEDEDEAAAP
jgi:hypothetical protein